MLTLKEMAERMSANTWFKNPFTILPPKKQVSLSAVSSDGIKMLNWMRHFHILSHLPATHESLSELSIGELRLVASVFKPYVVDQMRECNRFELIQFITGHQSNVEMYRPLPPLPFGSLPKLDTYSI